MIVESLAARLERSSFCEELFGFALNATSKKAGVEDGNTAQINALYLIIIMS